MPECQICGKVLKNPKTSSHINSKFHQQKLREIKSPKIGDLVKDPSITHSIDEELVQLKKIVLELENRIIKIEKKLNREIVTKDYAYGKSKVVDFEKEFINLINHRSNLQPIKGNFPLKELRDIFTNEFNITDREFEDNILRLYRKQLIDLQAGGNPSEYHLVSPTGKRFYYLIAKK